MTSSQARLRKKRVNPNDKINLNDDELDLLFDGPGAGSRGRDNEEATVDDKNAE